MNSRPLTTKLGFSNIAFSDKPAVSTNARIVKTFSYGNSSILLFSAKYFIDSSSVNPLPLKITPYNFITASTFSSVVEADKIDFVTDFATFASPNISFSLP